MTIKEKARAINVAIQYADASAIDSLVRIDYVQHTPNVADGRQGLQELVGKIARSVIPPLEIRNMRIIQDGDFVVLHHDVQWPNRKVMMEIFRFEDGLAAEHWSGLVDHPEVTANGHSMVDGSFEVTDLNKTESNKALARSFVETVLVNGKFNQILDYFDPEVIQHNPYIDNGVEGLIRGVEELGKKGVTLEIDRVWRVFGEGNFALVCSEGKFAGKPAAFFDLFRMEDDKVVEHWDVIQEIPALDKRAHDNAFFGHK